MSNPGIASVWALAGILLSTGVVLADEPLYVGVAAVDITGEDAVILDPLRAKAMYFRQGNEEIAIVECDQIGVGQEICREVRKQAQVKTGIPYSNICIAATHTHMASPSKPVGPAILEAIGRAKDSAKKTELFAGIGVDFHSAHNRRYWMKNGSVMFNPMFLNPNIIRAVGPIDPYVPFVLLNDASSGKPFASITNYALHCDTVKEYGAKYQKEGTGSAHTVSADFPYWLEESLQREFGSVFFNLFVTGCCGNINHWDFSKPGPQSGHKTKTRQLGESLGNAVKKELDNLERQNISLAARTRVMQVPLQTYSEEDLRWAKGISIKQLSGKSEEPTEREQFLNSVKKRRILELAELREKKDTISLDVQVFRISDDVAIVTLPGEMFVEYQLTIKNLSPFKNTIVIELANASVAYVPNRTAFSQGGYEVVNSRLAPGGGEMMVEAAIQMLKELKSACAVYAVSDDTFAAFFKKKPGV